jgi:hypothetical protein
VTRWRLALQLTEERDMKRNEKNAKKVVVRGSNKENPARLPCQPFFGCLAVDPDEPVSQNPAVEKRLDLFDHEAR